MIRLRYKDVKDAIIQILQQPAHIFLEVQIAHLKREMTADRNEKKMRKQTKEKKEKKEKDMADLVEGRSREQA